MITDAGIADGVSAGLALAVVQAESAFRASQDLLSRLASDEVGRGPGDPRRRRNREEIEVASRAWCQAREKARTLRIAWWSRRSEPG